MATLNFKTCLTVALVFNQVNTIILNIAMTIYIPGLLHHKMLSSDHPSCPSQYVPIRIMTLHYIQYNHTTVVHTIFLYMFHTSSTFFSLFVFLPMHSLHQSLSAKLIAYKTHNLVCQASTTYRPKTELLPKMGRNDDTDAITSTVMGC